MLIDLHGLAVALEAPARIAVHWDEIYDWRPHPRREPDITLTLRIAPGVPAPPTTPPIYTQGDLLAIHETAPVLTLHFPRFGQLRVDLQAAHTDGAIVEGALETYGVLEDLMAMGLTGHLRRRGLFLIHAFAAACHGRALLLVGDIGSGKTTTGISLLRAGWKLLSNDSPILTMADGVTAVAYPGLLSVHADTVQRFPELNSRTTPRRSGGAAGVRQKTTFAAESIYPDIWIQAARVGAVVFPRVAHQDDHRFTRLGGADALKRLLPNAIDRWDAEMIPTHLQLLKALVVQAPAYALELGENLEQLPDLMQTIVLQRA
jgi:hypothetical protein